eukprot:7666816-Heterocapsa_arctica.AAC.1
MTQEEIFHVPKIITQERITQQHVGQCGATARIARYMVLAKHPLFCEFVCEAIAREERMKDEAKIEMIVEVPVLMTQEESVHMPTIVTHHRHHHEHVEQIVGIEVPMIQEEMVHVPTITQQEKISQQYVEMT